MTTNTRGRSGWGARGTYGRTGGTTRPKMTKRATTSVPVPPKYKGVCDTFAWKIASFKTLYNQTYGPAKYHRPTPTVLNNFANWINKGAVIQICTPNQVAKWARMYNKNFNPRNCTPTACTNVLNHKFGKNTIKAVARTKTGSFMVVTSPTWKGKPFCFPK